MIKIYWKHFTSVKGPFEEFRERGKGMHIYWITQNGNLPLKCQVACFSSLENSHSYMYNMDPSQQRHSKLQPVKSSNWNKINEESGQPPTTSQSLGTLRFHESFSSRNNSASTVTSKLTATFPSRFLFYALHHVPGYSAQSRLIFCHQLMLLNVRHLIKLKGRKVLNNLFCQAISLWESSGKLIALLTGSDEEIFLSVSEMTLEIIHIYEFCIYLSIPCIY